MKTLTAPFILLILFALLIGPLSAQDTTREPAPTVQPAPAAIVTAEAPSGVTVNINQPAATPAPLPSTTQPASILSLTLGELLTILGVSAVLLLSIGKILWDSGRDGTGGVDARVTALIEEARSNREYVAALRDAHATGNAAMTTALNATISVLKIVTPLTTGIKADDAALKLLEDIQRPVEEIVTATTPTSQGSAGAQPPADPAAFLTSFGRDNG